MGNSCPTCSSGSGRPMPQPAGSTAASVWAWPSSGTWSSFTAARSAPTARVPARERRSRLSCRLAAPDKVRLLLLRRERALAELAEGHLAFHRGFVHGSAVGHLQRVPFHRGGELEGDGVSLDRAGDLLFAENLRGVGAGQLLTVLLERHARRAGVAPDVHGDVPGPRDVGRLVLTQTARRGPRRKRHDGGDEYQRDRSDDSHGARLYAAQTGGRPVAPGHYSFERLPAAVHAP